MGTLHPNMPLGAGLIARKRAGRGWYTGARRRTRGDATVVERVLRAARLDVTLYNEVERDEAATTQAIYVVVIVAVASGLGSLLGSLWHGPGLVGFASEIITSLLNWVI